MNAVDYTDDSDFTLELDAPIPNSFLDEEGLRHAIVWDADLEVRYTLVDGNVLLESPVF